MPAKSPNNKVIGENILRLRTSQGLTQNDLAALIGVKCRGGGALISRIEGGYPGDPSLKKLRSLAKALGVTVDDILAKHTND